MSKNLEDWQAQDAVRLRTLFDERTDRSQAAFGADYGIGTQGMVWQYLSGTRPLNIDVLMKFASALKVSASEISPTLWKKVEDYFYSEHRDERVLLTAEQKSLLYIAERMKPEAKEKWLSIASSLPIKHADNPAPGVLGEDISDPHNLKHHEPDSSDQIEQPRRKGNE